MTPLFLLSPAPRCGTNFLYDVIRLHPKILISEVDESYLLPCFSMIEPFIANIIEHSSLPIGLRDPVRDEIRINIALSILKTFSPRNPVVNDELLLLKFPSTVGLENARFFPADSRFLVIVREGQDVIESTIRSFPWINMSYALARLNKGLRSIKDAKEMLGDRLMIVRFEDLVNNRKATVQLILAWLKLDPDDYLFCSLDSLKPRGSSDTAAQRGIVHWVGEDIIGFNPVNRSDNWSKLQKIRFLRESGFLQSEFGYATAPIEISPLDHLLARCFHFFDSLKYHLRPSFRELALRDLGSLPTLLT